MISRTPFRSLVLMVAFMGLLLSAVAQTPAKRYRVELEPTVRNGQLLLDVYAYLLAGDAFSLASSNFRFHIETTGLNLNSAVLDDNAAGPWDFRTDARGYRNLYLVRDGNSLVMNVLANSQLKNTMAGVGGPGNGQPLSPTRTRVGRVVIPITDASQTARLNWEMGAAAVMNWEATNVMKEGEFVVTRMEIPLCEAPTKPVVSASALSFCLGQQVTLSAGPIGTYQWYRDGAAINGATSNQYAATIAGAYTAVAINAVCESEAADSVRLTALPSGAPVLTRTGNMLIANLGGASALGLQWYYNGAAITGANGTTLKMDATGYYKLVVTTSCGTFSSREEFYVKPADNLANDGVKVQVIVAPNPYVEQTTLSLYLPTSAEVTVEVTTTKGARLKTLYKQLLPAGQQAVLIDARQAGMTPGSYFLHVKVGDHEEVLKLVQLN